MPRGGGVGGGGTGRAALQGTVSVLNRVYICLTLSTGYGLHESFNDLQDEFCCA